MPKKYTLVSILFSLFFVSTLYLLYLQFYKSRSTSLSTNNPVSGWQTYKDEKLGFSFNYPASYKVVVPDAPPAYILMLQGANYATEGSPLGLQNTGDYYFLSTSSDCKPKTVLANQYKQISSDNNKSFFDVDGYEGPDYKSAIIKGEQFCYELTCHTETNCVNQHFNEFQNIVSSFELTNQSSSSKTHFQKLISNFELYQEISPEERQRTLSDFWISFISKDNAYYSLAQNILQGSIKKLTVNNRNLPGALKQYSFYLTPNYHQFKNPDFTNSLRDVYGGTQDLFALYAFPDKLIWTTSGNCGGVRPDTAQEKLKFDQCETFAQEMLTAFE